MIERSADVSDLVWGGQPLGYLFGTGQVAAGHHDPATGLGQGTRHGSPKIPAGTDNETGFAFEIEKLFNSFFGHDYVLQ